MPAPSLVLKTWLLSTAIVKTPSLLATASFATRQGEGFLNKTRSDDATSAEVSGLAFINKAIDPSCVTSILPVSSICNIGVHTVTKRQENAAPSPLPGVSVNDKARPATCSTAWTTMSQCYPGAHPQPTISETSITITQTNAPTGNDPAITATISTVAEVSISAPAASGTGSIGFFLTPKLRNEIMELANAYCRSAKLRPRQDDETAGVACALSLDNFGSISDAIAQRIGSALDLTENNYQNLLQGVLKRFGANQLSLAMVKTILLLTVVQVVTGTLIASRPLLRLGVQAPPEVVQSVASSVIASKSMTSSSQIPAGTVFPGPPNAGQVSHAPEDISILTSALEAYFASQWPMAASSEHAAGQLCTHGAQPGVYSGVADYCQCTDGQMYPVITSSFTTTIDGTETALIDPCAYTEIPSATKDLGPTIKPTITPGPSLDIGTATCLPGGAAFRLEDIEDEVGKFCHSASKHKWKASYEPQATLSTVDNAFFAGQAQAQAYTVDSNEKGKDLYLQVKFDTDGCAVGEPQVVDFKKSGKDWCTNNFMKIVNDCDTEKGDSDFWKHGGMLYEDCVQWVVADGTL